MPRPEPRRTSAVRSAPCAGELILAIPQKDEALLTEPIEEGGDLLAVGVPRRRPLARRATAPPPPAPWRAWPGSRRSHGRRRCSRRVSTVRSASGSATRSSSTYTTDSWRPKPPGGATANTAPVGSRRIVKIGCSSPRMTHPRLLQAFAHRVDDERAVAHAGLDHRDRRVPAVLGEFRIEDRDARLVERRLEDETEERQHRGTQPRHRARRRAGRRPPCRRGAPRTHRRGRVRRGRPGSARCRAARGASDRPTARAAVAAARAPPSAARWLSTAQPRSAPSATHAMRGAEASGSGVSC